MAVAANTIFSQRKGGKILLRFNSNGYVNCAANSTVNSDIGNPANDQIVGAAITKLCWSSPGAITIARGANVIITLNGSGGWDFSQVGWSETEYPTANLVVTISDSNSTCFVELSKIYASGSPPDADAH